MVASWTTVRTCFLLYVSMITGINADLICYVYLIFLSCVFRSTHAIAVSFDDAMFSFNIRFVYFEYGVWDFPGSFGIHKFNKICLCLLVLS